MLDLTALILLALSVLSPPPQQPMTTRATRYADTVPDEGGTPRCVHELPRDVYRALHPLRVAHRTLPCGTLLVVEAGSRRTLAAVLDRGPWNRVGLPWSPAPDRANMAHPPRSGAQGAAPLGTVVPSAVATAPPPYRGDLDVSPQPADVLGLTLRVGRLRVRYWPAAWQPFVVRSRRSRCLDPHHEVVCGFLTDLLKSDIVTLGAQIGERVRVQRVRADFNAVRPRSRRPSS